jgi:DNA gyrase subunit A
MKLAEGDEVISMTILRGVETTTEERQAYLKYAGQQRRLLAGEGVEAETEAADEEDDAAVADVALSQERLAELGAGEQFILNVTMNGFGIRTSAYEYRLTNRGGQGIMNVDTRKRGDKVVAVFPVEDQDGIVMMSDGGQVIRCPVDDIRIARRGSAGVTLLRLSEGERVVSVARLADTGNGEEGAEGEEEGPAG